MTALQIIEHAQQRVLTTHQLSEAYEADVKAISKNFNNNANRYSQGKHYYLLEGDELKAFRKIYELPENLNKLYLWTEKGAWLHAKSLGTDKAWEAYEILVDDYFKKMDLIKLIANDPIMAIRYQQIEMGQRLFRVEEKTLEVKKQAAIAAERAILAHQRLDLLDSVNPRGNSRQQLVALVNKYAQQKGLPYNLAWSEFKKAFNKAFHTNITLKMAHYLRANNKKKMTVPQYLEASGQISDGLRVASKMLNNPGT